jgi:hypothetical protein
LFKNYAQPTLSYHFIDLLIKTNHPIISKIVCLPNLNYCVYNFPGSNFKDIKLQISTEQTCSPLSAYKSLYMNPIKANLLLFNPPEYKAKKTNQYTFVIPDSFKNNLEKCNLRNKHIVFLNLFLVTTKQDKLYYMHANIIIINLIQKTIERFDPHGGSVILHENLNGGNKFTKNLKKIYKQELIDKILKSKFKSVLPDYKYISLNETCPYLGPQANVDAFNGMCITWSLMYFLLRVLNPNIKQSEINKKMLIGSKDEILDKMLRFQGYVINFLKYNS